MKAGFWEILLIVILVLILFGHSKIPDLMKNLASGINVFKKELNSDKKEEKAPAEKKPVAKKAPAKKAAKKPVVKKAVAAKPAVKKAPVKKAPAKKAVKKK